MRSFLNRCKSRGASSVERSGDFGSRPCGPVRRLFIFCRRRPIPRARATHSIAPRAITFPTRCTGSPTAAAAVARNTLLGSPAPTCKTLILNDSKDVEALRSNKDSTYRLADCVRQLRSNINGASGSLCHAYLQRRNATNRGIDARALADALRDEPRVAAAPCAPRDALVVHVRAGDWLRDRPRHVVGAEELGAWLRAWQRPAPCRRIVLVTGFAQSRPARDAERTRAYVHGLLATVADSAGLPAVVHNSASADADFKVLATARWLLVGAGGFGLLAGAIKANYRLLGTRARPGADRVRRLRLRVGKGRLRRARGQAHAAATP